MTDPKKPRRMFVGVRLNPSALEWIDAEATRNGTTRSDTIRSLLTEAVTARLRRQPK